MIEVFFIILGSLTAVGILLYMTHRPARQDDTVDASATDNGPSDTTQKQAADTAASTSAEETEECCGMHETCERDSLLAAVSERAEYFDDEELDRYAGRSADSYSDRETEEFREVLLTLLPDDVAPWARSIQLRGIELPETVREELLLIVSESRK